jgi:hypothetical protein
MTLQYGILRPRPIGLLHPPEEDCLTFGSKSPIGVECNGGLRRTPPSSDVFDIYEFLAGECIHGCRHIPAQAAVA